MPSKTKRQAKFMRAAAHDPNAKKDYDIDPRVAKEFNQADKARSKTTDAIRKTRKS